jgi:hypothetical protein
MPRAPRIRMMFWTERFLGTSEKCLELLDRLETMDGGRWVPEKWNECEPVRYAYNSDSREEIAAKWTGVRGKSWVANDLMFRKKKPGMQAWATCWKGSRPFLNSLSLDLNARDFESADGTARLMSIFTTFICWSRAAYASARGPGQKHLRIGTGTPLDRLECLDWLSFFGKPYVDLFGGDERVLGAPCFQAERLNNGVILLASSRFNSPEIAESTDVLSRLEEYFGRDCFLTEDFSEIPCRVPSFDMAEVINRTEDDPGDSQGPPINAPIVIRNRKTKEPKAVIALLNSDSAESTE